MNSNSSGGNDPIGTRAGSTGTAATGAAGQSRSTTKQVKDTAKRATEQAAGAAHEQARSTFEKQKNRTLDELENLAAGLRQESASLRAQHPSGLAVRAIDTVADRLESLSRNLDGKDLDEIVRDVEDFARRNPSLFIAGSALIGFSVIRFFKSSGRISNLKFRSSRDYRTDVAEREAPFVSYGEEI